MTDVSRRSVIGAGAAAIAASALGVGGPLVGAAGAHAADPTYTSAEKLYRRSRFAALRGKGFAAGSRRDEDPGPAHRDRRPSRRGGGIRDQLPADLHRRSAGPEQGTYSLRRDGFAKTSMFVVPDADRRTYTAVVHSAGGRRCSVTGTR